MSEDQNKEIQQDEKMESAEEINKPTSQQQTIESAESIKRNADSKAELQTANSKIQTEEMEVHHHPHVEKKNFKEYLLEGLMIFIAVTMGFFAENIREYFADVKIEKEYLSTYKQQLLINKEQLLDLKNDIINYTPVVDSLADLFFKKIENQDLTKTARLVSKSKVLLMTNIDIDAYQQLVNSGGFKYIHNVALKDTMARYADAIKEFQNGNSFMLSYIAQNNVVINSLEDWHSFFDDHTFEIIPYPELTERERRLMVAYNKTRYALARSSEASTQYILLLNEHILDMVNKELDK
jgi:hypothetical protein